MCALVFATLSEHKRSGGPWWPTKIKMNIAADPAKAPLAGEKSQVRMRGGDSLVYLVLALLVWGTWRISKLGLFTAGDDTGYWIGVTGSVMMLLLLLYPLRKHLRFAHGWGNIRFWFWLHVVLGVFGPLLILLHSNFKTSSLNAAVALYSMLLVAGSGVVGRFIFLHINRALQGEQAGLQDLQQRVGLDQQDVHSRLAFAPGVEQRLKDFELREHDPKPGLPSAARAVLWLPWLRWREYRRCAAELDALLERLAAAQHWSKDDLQRRRRHARRLVDHYLTSVVRVAQFSAYSFLFSLWHVAHIPFVYVLILTALVHVYAVHAY